MNAKRQLILADINSSYRDGVLTGHACAVATNYLKVFHGWADIRIAGGAAFAEKFPDIVRLSHHVNIESSRVRNKLRVLHNMWQLFHRCKDNVIILQSSAVATSFFGIAFFKARCTPVYLIQYNAESLNSPLKRFLFNIAKNKISGIICPNDKIGKTYGLPYCAVPDYIYVGKETVPSVTYEEKQYDFCMIGVVCRDKGMIEAAQKLAGTPYRVIIAGRPASDDIERELRSIAAEADNIELRLRYVDAEEYTDIIRASRYGILNYSDAYSEHSSGVIFDLLFNGVPIIGRRCQTLQIVEEFGMGQIFNEIDQWNVSSLPARDTYEKYQQSIHRYYHSHEQYREALVRFVTENV